jgi:hypothetical protein
MIPLGIGAIIFACVFGGALGGMVLRTRVPEHHLTKETEDSVKLGMGMIATLAALVIGLLVASAKSSFDTKDAELRQFSANLILLDRQLVHYGPEASEARALLRRYTAFKIDSTWPDEASHRVDDPDGWILLEDVQDKLRALAPATTRSAGSRHGRCRSAATSRAPAGSWTFSRRLRSVPPSW